MTLNNSKSRLPQVHCESKIEGWDGLEWTVARISNTFPDQIVETGHFDRSDDLAKIAALGIRTLRYPTIWDPGNHFA